MCHHRPVHAPSRLVTSQHTRQASEWAGARHENRTDEPRCSNVEFSCKAGANYRINVQSPEEGDNRVVEEQAIRFLGDVTNHPVANQPAPVLGRI